MTPPPWCFSSSLMSHIYTQQLIQTIFQHIKFSISHILLSYFMTTGQGLQNYACPSVHDNIFPFRNVPQTSPLIYVTWGTPVDIYLWSNFAPPFQGCAQNLGIHNYSAMLMWAHFCKSSRKEAKWVLARVKGPCRWSRITWQWWSASNCVKWFYVQWLFLSISLIPVQFRNFLKKVAMANASITNE